MPGEGRSLSSRQTQDVVRDQEIGQADLADYFGSLPHTDLLKSVARRIVDRRVLHLIKMWLECAVEETDDRGRKTRTTEARDNRRGIPQGSPISPLLANLYMRRFVLGWKMGTMQRILSLGAVDTLSSDKARKAAKTALAREPARVFEHALHDAVASELGPSSASTFVRT